MNNKIEHNKYLKLKGDFNFDCPHLLFNESERKLLKKYGNWFLGLTIGDLKPFTKSQKQFIKVANGKKKPETKMEKIWSKFLCRKKLEKENPEKFNLNYMTQKDNFFSRDDFYKLHPNKKNKF
tara:strand:- start:558 stop:926 length:369 start_codon:yes stop_codon:yes gene_type:complete